VLIHLFLLAKQVEGFCRQYLRPRGFFFWGSSTTTGPPSERGWRYIREHILQLKKVPLHIAVVLPEEEILTKEIAHIICWCIGSGIQHVTIYDLKGISKQRATELQQIIVQNCHSFVGAQPCYLCMHCLGFPTVTNKIELSTEIKRSATKIDNDTGLYGNNRSNNIGGSENNYYNIYIASGLDGRAQVTDVAYQLCKSLYSGASKDAKVDQQFVDDKIRGFLVNYPEPDLIMNFDSSIVMSGFMPWHLRLTEILYVGPLQDFTLQQFIRGLYKYSKTDKRHGT